MIIFQWSWISLSKPNEYHKNHFWRQKGADRAGLDVALVHNFIHGGWYPKGRRAEDGQINANDEVVDLNVVDLRLSIAGDATVLMVPALHQPAHGALQKAGQITQDEPSVLACQFDLALKRAG